MHARIEQLLSLRDGEPVDAAVQAHVERLRAVRAALARLQAMRQRLRTLPDVVASGRDGWASVERRIVDAQPRRRAASAHCSRRRRRVGRDRSPCWRVWRLQDRPHVSSLEPFANLGRGGRRGPADSRSRSCSRQSQAARGRLLAALPERPAVERAGHGVADRHARGAGAVGRSPDPAGVRSRLRPSTRRRNNSGASASRS